LAGKKMAKAQKAFVKANDLIYLFFTGEGGGEPLHPHIISINQDGTSFENGKELKEMPCRQKLAYSAYLHHVLRILTYLSV
jgi:diadenosine tetraphosphate (Ap4A) HIT family hydrolase